MKAVKNERAAQGVMSQVDEGWVFCPRCLREKRIKLCKKRSIGGGYEMKAGDRRAAIFAGFIVCPRCSYEQPIPPSPSTAQVVKTTSPKRVGQVTKEQEAQSHAREHE